MVWVWQKFRYLFSIIFFLSIWYGRVQASKPTWIKVSPVMLCLDLVRSVVFFFSSFFSYHTLDYVHENKLGNKKKAKTFIEYWVCRDNERTEFIVSKESKESTDMYKTSNVYPSTVRPSNLHRRWNLAERQYDMNNHHHTEDESWIHETTCTNYKFVTVSSWTSFSFSWWICAFLSCSLCNGNDCVNCERCRKWFACPVIWRH